MRQTISNIAHHACQQPHPEILASLVYLVVLQINTLALHRWTWQISPCHPRQGEEGGHEAKVEQRLHVVLTE
jgi:hypothetical protein